MKSQAKYKEWDNYQKGINYNREMPIDFYTLCDTNSDFDAGDQWPHAGLDDDFLQPVFNICNKFTTFFVAYLASTDIGTLYQSIYDSDENEDMSDDILNASFNEFKERVKFSKKYRQAMKDGTITGDYISHMTFSDKKPYGGAFGKTIGQIEFDLIDATNFYVSNPRNNDIESQKWVGIDGKDYVSVLQEEQDQFMEDMKDTIVSDNDTETLIGEYGDIIFEPIIDDSGQQQGEATWFLQYYKKKETREEPMLDENGEPMVDSEGNPMMDEIEEEWVYSTKLTQNGYIWKDRPMGFNVYPVDLGNWIEQKNTYHGQSFLKNVIPAQIFINQGFAAAMKHTLDTAFEKFFYNVKVLPDGINAEVSAQVGVDLPEGSSMDQAGKFMSPGNMSDKVISLIDLAYSYIKDVVSLTDAITGNVNPEQASGVSIVSSAKQAAIPIEVPQLNSFDWVEDIMKTYKNMVQNLYGERPVLMEVEGKTVVGNYDFSKLKRMYKQPKIEVGESGYWSEDNLLRILDNLFSQGILDVITYLEEMPASKIPNKQKLIDRLKEKQVAQATPQLNTPNVTQELTQNV